MRKRTRPALVNYPKRVSPIRSLRIRPGKPKARQTSQHNIDTLANRRLPRPQKQISLKRKKVKGTKFVRRVYYFDAAHIDTGPKELISRWHKVNPRARVSVTIGTERKGDLTWIGTPVSSGIDARFRLLALEARYGTMLGDVRADKKAALWAEVDVITIEKIKHRKRRAKKPTNRRSNGKRTSLPRVRRARPSGVRKLKLRKWKHLPAALSRLRRVSRKRVDTRRAKLPAKKIPRLRGKGKAKAKRKPTRTKP